MGLCKNKYRELDFIDLSCDWKDILTSVFLSSFLHYLFSFGKTTLFHVLGNHSLKKHMHLLGLSE